MGVVTTSPEELRARAVAAFERFVAVVEQTPERTTVGDGTWTVGQVAAHVLTVFRRYTERDRNSIDGLSPTMAEVDLQNQRELAEVAGLSLSEVLEELRQQHERLLGMEYDPDATYPFHFGERVDFCGGWGNLIGELLLHGYDVARAGGRRWPIAERDALLVFNALFQFLAGAANPEATRGLVASFEFRPRGGRPHTLVVDRGSARVVESSELGGRPDVVLAGPATPFLLNLYGRTSPWRAALRGVGIRGGRRPWLGLRLAGFFR